MRIEVKTNNRTGVGALLTRGAAVCLLAAVATAAHAANGPPPKAQMQRVDDLKAVAVQALPAVDREARLDEDAQVVEAAPLRYAIPTPVSVTPDTAGHWETLADGGRLWRHRVHAPNATDLNFGFTRFHLPAGATLYVYSESHDEYLGPYTNADNRDHGQHWTPMVPGERAVIELYLPASYGDNAKLRAARAAVNPQLRGASMSDTLVLELGSVGVGYRDLFGLDGKPNLTRQGACNIDTICSQGDNWRDEIRSAAQYSLGGGYFCSGTLIMDVPGSFDPYFITANHCGLSAGNAPSLVVLWNFEAAVCGALSGGVASDTQSGATLLSARADTDTTLVLLSAAPPPAYDVFYSGWDATGAAPQSSVGISHPSNDEKALAFNDDPLTTINSCIGPVGVGNTHWFVNNYEEGMTEPGSSGSGIWNPNSTNPYNPNAKHLVGVLSGGGAACSGTVPNNLSDCYGKLSATWSSGATAGQRLKDWLDPANTGTLIVDGSNPGGVGGICGDSALNSGESCDDGNDTGGDGCSATCQVEDGYQCTDPIPGGVVNGVPDGSFEAGAFGGVWTEASTTFGTPLCDVAGCGTGTGTGPNSGAWWVWFGGIAAAETGSVEQSVVIETTDTELTFARESIICDSASDFVNVLIDGNLEFSWNGADGTCGALGYNTETIDLSAYNDGLAHTIRVESSIFGINASGSNFFVDDVSIDRGGLEPTPSMCTLLPNACFSETFDPVVEGGGLTGWTTFNNGAVALDWGTTDDGFCGSVNWVAGNYTGGAGVAACVDSDAAGNGVVNSYLCSPGIDLTTAVNPNLAFDYNYQVFSTTAEDAFEVLVGTGAPSALTIGSYTSIFNTSADAGSFTGAGTSESLDVSGFSGSTVHVCYRYSGDFDWYGQVDNVTVTADACMSAADTDGDGVTDDLDNCINDANPLQVDSNGDNIGNVCDGDIAGQAGPGADDCTVNFFDLGRMKQVFFTNDADADLVGMNNSEPDGVVNFFDLGRMKQVFFQPPGPSANGCN